MNALEKVVVIGTTIALSFAGFNIGWSIGDAFVSGIDSIEARDEAVRPAEVGSVPTVRCVCDEEGFTSSCTLVGEGLVLLSL